MGTDVRWSKFGIYSGPAVKGTCLYVLPENPTGFDVIAAATARPEGGSFDIVNMYDGTAVTYGLFQWTFTSGRLHKLLAETCRCMGLARYYNEFGCPLIALTRLTVDDEDLYLDGKRVTDFFKLRNVCTPLGGKVPRVGKYWDQSKKIALLFSKLGEDPIAQKVQMDFFRNELKKEAGLKRPKLGGDRISEYLPTCGWDTPVEGGDCILVAAQALFWSAWQNAPRQAERCLFSALHGFEMPLNSPAGLVRFARKIGLSNFGRWGVVKARNAVGSDGKPKPYTSRYEKMAIEINKVMNCGILPALWT